MGRGQHKTWVRFPVASVECLGTMLKWLKRRKRSSSEIESEELGHGARPEVSKARRTHKLSLSGMKN